LFRWYVVQTKARQELTAAQNLENQLFSVFVPRYVRKRVVRNAVVEEILPLFPSYLFVSLDLTKDRWRSVFGTRGVVTLLASTEDNASPLPRGFVEDLIAETDLKGFLKGPVADEIILDYAPGDLVKVSSGIFEGLSGTCEAVKKDRATVLLTLLSREARVILPTKTISILNPHDGYRR
jgi:transcriptional antiterminator RfaH